MSSDAVMNVSFKNLYNKRKIWIDNRGGSRGILSRPFGPASADPEGGRNGSFIWEGHINDPQPTSDRSNYQWVVFRRWILSSKVSVVNAGNAGYDDGLISWETPGGAYTDMNPPSYFRQYFTPSSSGQKIISTAEAELTAGVVPAQDEDNIGGHVSRCVAIAPYCAYGGCDIWVGAQVPAGGAGTNIVAEGQFNTGIGGKLMDSWEEGVMCANFFERKWKYEVRGEHGEQLGITCRNAADGQKSSHLLYGGLPGVIVQWIAELDVYDILPEAEERYNPNGTLPATKNIPRI